MWKGQFVFAAVLIGMGSVGAFAPSALTTSRGLALSRERTGMGLCMQSGELNRQARRNMAKAEKRSKNAKPKGGVEAMNEVSAVMAESMNGKAPEKVEKPNALEELRQKTLQNREEALKRLEDVRTGKVVQPKKELPGIENLRQVDEGVLFGVERFLFFGALTAGGIWVLAGLGTAFDAYLIATKQKVPGDADSLVSAYLYPLLTPGLVGIIACSLLLGLLQVYKFEGGKAAATPEKFVKRKSKE
eukprot:CAMPEP_0177709290 /NCGR_PEP_ID=MMETSP0484_2-20121128/10723_1 /TAXON_ID=354590 /ORGANISM="Rhodomonas lens, Strain RHODO" /LENGTH=244 /DNA_ID=CAMNT_0019220895 /DNA_START=21 /DNA_END=755 /DNA_ORIENTATION=-